MYQFTTETIINSNLDSNGVLAKFQTVDDIFKVSRVGNFDPATIVSCFKNPYVAPVKESVVKTITTVPVATNVYRLAVTLKRQDSYVSEYANDMSYNSLQKYYEVTGVATAAALVTALVNVISKEIKLKDNTVMNAVDGGSASLTLTVADEYTHFVKVELQELTASTSLTGYDSFTTVENILSTGTLTLGKEGFGTVKQITKNLRLPTLANTNWTAISQEERPIAGGQYSQYSIRIKTDRGTMGTSVVGQDVQSITDHVFYVLSTLVTDWETELTDARIQIVNALTGANVNTLV